MLDLCAQPPVARRFSFTADDLDRLAQLVAASGVRWGLDMASRKPYGLDHLGQNTWAAGLDRLLLGVTMDEEGNHFIGTALPLDEVDSSDVELVGRLAEFVDRLGTALTAFAADHPMPRWVELAKETIEALTATSTADSWQTGQAFRVLTALAGSEAAEQAVLTRAELQALLADGLGGRAGRANFRTGTLTVCTMYPMRSVPHRVVCLLGMDDLAFPRRTRSDGDDVLAGDPWVGDRDRRSEDRQLLLDAIMSATEHLLVLYSGADPRTGAHAPARRADRRAARRGRPDGADRRRQPAAGRRPAPPPAPAVRRRELRRRRPAPVQLRRRGPARRSGGRGRTHRRDRGLPPRPAARRRAAAARWPSPIWSASSSTR